jgi:hypothetical protein
MQTPATRERIDGAEDVGHGIEEGYSEDFTDRKNKATLGTGAIRAAVCE